MTPMLVLAVLGVVTSQNPGWPLADVEAPASALSRPEAMPDDPEFRPTSTGEACHGAFALFSFTPACASRIQPAERALELGTGIHADRAWLLTTGRPEIQLAILATGIDWSNREVVGRIALNAKELPPPELTGRPAGLFDANGDGAFDVRDYTSATGTVAPTVDRVIDRLLSIRADRGDANHNGLLDPQDLILIFADGVDGDANGYVDDIAGWDFVDDDPDASEDEPSPLFDVALATSNDGIAGAGVCPRCTGLPIRLSQGGLAMGMETALAMVYAADRGANVILAPAVAPGGSRVLAEAAAYATQRQAAIVASAGTEGSRAPLTEWPSDQVLIIGSIGFDRARVPEATTAFARDPCTGAGEHVAIAAPGLCDGTEAAIAAGTLGLVFSAALGIPSRNVPPLAPVLTVREAYGILRETRDLLDNTPRPRSMLRVAPLEEQAGAILGRINARRAVEAIIRQRVPPVATFLSPAPREIVDPTPLLSFDVSARIESRGVGLVSWAIEWAIGDAPQQSAFAPVSSGTVAAPGPAMARGTLPIAPLFSDPTAPPLGSKESTAVTLRILLTREVGGEITRAEARRVIYVHRDLELLPAFPIDLGASAVAAPRAFDLDGNGRDELVIATDDGRIHAIDAHGQALSGWPVTMPRASVLERDGNPGHAIMAFATTRLSELARQPILATPAVAPLERGGPPRVVVLTTEGRLMILDATGTELRSTLIASNPRGPTASLANLAIADLDRDGTAELIVTTSTGKVLVLDPDLATRGRFPLELGAPLGAPAIGDLDGNGVLDVVVASRNQLFVIDGRSVAGDRPRIIPGFPVQLTPAIDGRTSGLESLSSPAAVLADTNRDGALEIVLASRGRPAMIFTADGALMERESYDRATFGGAADLPRDGPDLAGLGEVVSLGDLDADGRPEIVRAIARASRLARLTREERPENALSISSREPQRFVEGAPHALSASPRGGAVILDLDEDGRPEVVFDSGDGTLDALNVQGTRPRLWPKLIEGVLAGSPLVADVDGDGRLEVVAVTGRGQVFAFRTRGREASWRGAQHDARGSGNLEADDEAQSRPTDAGCAGCAAVEPTTGAVLLLWIAIPMGVRRARSMRKRQVA